MLREPDTDKPNVNIEFVNALYECEQSNGHWAPLLDAEQMVDICYACCSTIRMIQCDSVRDKQFKILRKLLGTSYTDGRIQAWIRDTVRGSPP